MISKAEVQKRKRINVALWAYAYEEKDRIIVGDEVFDIVCKQVHSNLRVKTDNPELDAWFKKHFDPSTGSWIGVYPEKYLKGIITIYNRLLKQGLVR